MKKFIFILMLGILTQISTAQANTEPELIDVFDHWETYFYQTPKGRVCYMGSVPQKSVGKYKTRGETYMIINHNTQEKITNVISITAGYTYKNKSPVIMKIHNKTYRFYSHKDTAWSLETDEKKIIESMKKGSKMTVKGYSKRNTQTIDTYSLKGFTSALKAINKKCNISD